MQAYNNINLIIVLLSFYIFKNRFELGNSSCSKYNINSQFHLRGITEEESRLGRRIFSSGERHCPPIFLLFIFVPTRSNIIHPLLRSTETFQESFDGSTKNFLLSAGHVGCCFCCSNYSKFVKFFF